MPISHSSKYVAAVVIMALIGIVGILVVVGLRPAQDNTALITLIIGFLAPTTLSLLTFIKAEETHHSVNSRLDTLLAVERRASRAEGFEEGRTHRDPA